MSSLGIIYSGQFTPSHIRDKQSLIKRLKNKSLDKSLVPNLPNHMLPFLLTKFKQIFYILNIWFFHSLVWLRYKDNIFFICSHGKEILFKVGSCSIIVSKYTCLYMEENIIFLLLNFSLLNGSIYIHLYIKSTDRHLNLHFSLLHYIQKDNIV